MKRATVMAKWCCLVGLALASFACGDDAVATGGGGGGATGGGGSSASAGGTDPDVGCADGSRELYTLMDSYLNIAGCEGAWTVPGVVSDDSRAPQCGREAGNFGVNDLGTGCSVEDLCAEGWHVCADASEFGVASDDAACLGVPTPGTVFWLTRQTSLAGELECGADAGSGDNLVGCGTMGTMAPESCAPLGQVVTSDDCEAPWLCDGALAGEVVTKSDPLSSGGVLCCRD